jgi:hypothetical protein
MTLEEIVLRFPKNFLTGAEPRIFVCFFLVLFLTDGKSETREGFR